MCLDLATDYSPHNSSLIDHAPPPPPDPSKLQLRIDVPVPSPSCIHRGASHPVLELKNTTTSAYNAQNFIGTGMHTSLRILPSLSSDKRVKET